MLLKLFFPLKTICNRNIIKFKSSGTLSHVDWQLPLFRRSVLPDDGEGKLLPNAGNYLLINMTSYQKHLMKLRTSSCKVHIYKFSETVKITTDSADNSKKYRQHLTLVHFKCTHKTALKKRLLASSCLSVRKIVTPTGQIFTKFLFPVFY
jgi:hypothetical protein